MIYLVMFITSAIFCMIADYERKNEHKKLALLFDIIAILIPAILAGIRNENIGYDVKLYLNNLQKMAVNSDSLILYTEKIQIQYSNIGIGFTSIIYLISQFFKDVHWTYFFVNLIPMILFYMGIKDNKSKSKNAIVWFLMLLLLYNISLNLLRQIIAISIIYFAKKYIYEKKLLNYIIFCIIAFLFHETAIIFLFIYFVYWYIDSTTNILRVFVVSFGVFALMYSYQFILSTLASNGFIAQRYIETYSTGLHFAGMNNVYSALCMFYIVGIAMIVSLKKWPANKIYFYCVLSLLNCMFFMLGDIHSETFRIAYYTTAFIPEILVYAGHKFKGKGEILVDGIVIIIVIYFWYTLFIINGFAATVPYISDFF